MTVEELWQLYDVFVCSDAYVHLGGKTVSNKLFFIMMGDSVETNDLILMACPWVTLSNWDEMRKRC